MTVDTNYKEISGLGILDFEHLQIYVLVLINWSAKDFVHVCYRSKQQMNSGYIHNSKYPPLKMDENLKFVLI